MTPISSAYVRKALADQGSVVAVASGGGEGLDVSLACDYDLVVLDLMLPDRDGTSVLSELRRAGKQTGDPPLTRRPGTLSGKPITWFHHRSTCRST